MMKRMISLLLCMVMVLSMVPVQAIAQETAEEPTELFSETEATELVTEPAEKETTAPTEAMTEPAEEHTVPESVEEMVAETAGSDVAMGAVASGTCGDNVTWILDDAGTLTISGSGTMKDFSWYPPWDEESVFTVVIEDGVKSIGRFAFSGCTNLNNITIPDSVTMIGGYAFERCRNLMSVSIPNSVTIIDDDAFHYCHNLTNVTIPNSVTFIGDYAFAECTSLTSIVIPESVTRIGFSAFSECTSLTSITIPASVNSIGNGPFRGCTNLSGIWVDGDNSTYCSDAFGVLFDKNKEIILQAPSALSGSYTIPNSVTTIESYAFVGCFNMTSVIIPNGVTNIKSNAFTNCKGLSNVFLPASVGEIGYGAFAGCTGLINLEMVDGLTSIGNHAFKSCEKLSNVVIPNSVSSIGINAFQNCGNLTTLLIGDGVTSIKSGAFSDCVSLTKVVIPDGVTYIENKTFSDCTALTEVIIPQSVVSIGNETFYNCTNLVFVELPEKLTSIGKSAFQRSESLTEIVIPDKVTSLSENIFAVCRSLSSVILPRELTTIEHGAFSNCSGLTSIVLPQNTAVIKSEAFSFCNNLTNITIPKSVTEIDLFAFGFCSKLTDVYYTGTEADWTTLTSSISSGNEALLNASIHYNWTGENEEPEVEVNVAYGAVKEITGGTASTKELNRIQDYLEDWEKAYNKWVKAVNKGLKKFGATDEEEEESAIRQEADRMRTHDANEGKKNGKYLNGNLNGFESEAYHALASFLYDGITNVPNFSSVDLANPFFAMQLIESILAEFEEKSESFPYENATISIEANRVFSINFGQMTINPHDGSAPFSVIIFSDMNEGKAALRTYVGELKNLSISATYNVANAVYQDILGVSLSTLTSTYVNDAVTTIENKLAIKLSEKLGQAGVGENLITTLDECYNFYTWVKKLIDLGSEGDISGTLEKIKGLKFEDTTVSKWATKRALSTLRKANTKMQNAIQEYLDGTLVEEKKGFWSWLFGCPVSISVYNSAGEQIGYVGEDDIWYTDDICITELGGVKEIVSFTEEELSFTVTATDYGTMSCMFERYDETFVPVGRLNYYNIILEPEHTFQVSVPETLDEKTETVAITSGGEAFFPDEYISAEDSAGVTISCSAVTEDGIAGGTVSGTGTYIRGDSVILRAEPYDGFRFVGWFDGEHLIGTENICEFPARENREIIARFYQQKPILIELEADIGGNAIGGGRYDSGDTVTVIAIPKNGYNFAGWYVGEEVISTEPEYSFQAGENLVLRAAFLYAYTYGQNVQIKLIEPWGIRANAKISTSAGVVDYSSLYDYGVYFIRKSALDRAGLTQSTISVADIVNDADAQKQTKADGVTVSSGYLSAIYDNDIYTYELNDSVFVMFYFITEEGADPIYVPVRERNLKDLAQQRMNDSTNFPNQLEREVYQKMTKLETDVADYRSDFANLSAPEKQKAPTLAQYHLGAQAAASSYSYGQNAQIKLIEPWGLKANVKVSNNGSVIDYNIVEEYGIVALADNSRTYADASEILQNQNAYVFSSKNGDATISNGYISATYSKDIFTYQLDTDIYVFGYVKDADGYHYGPVRNRNVHTLMQARMNDAENFPNVKERTVYADMIVLYDAITAYREDYFKN